MNDDDGLQVKLYNFISCFQIEEGCLYTFLVLSSVVRLIDYSNAIVKSSAQQHTLLKGRKQEITHYYQGRGTT